MVDSRIALVVMLFACTRPPTDDATEDGATSSDPEVGETGDATTDSSTSPTADTGTPWNWVGGTVTAHFDSIDPDQRLMVSDADGVFVRSHPANSSTVTVLKGVPIGGYVTALFTLGQTVNLQTAGGVQDGDELWFGFSGLGSNTTLGELNVKVADHGTEYGNTRVRVYSRTPERGTGAFEFTQPLSERARTLAGHLDIYAWAEGDPGQQTLAYATDVAAAGTPPNAVVDVTLDSWNHDPGWVEATYDDTRSGLQLIAMYTSRAEMGLDSQWDRMDPGNPSLLSAKVAVDPAFHTRHVAELSDHTWRKGGAGFHAHRLEIVDDIPDNGDTTTIAFTADHHPEHLLDLRADVDARSVEPIWPEDPNCDAIAFSMAHLLIDYVTPALPTYYIRWQMYAPLDTTVGMPQLDPDVLEILPNNIEALSFRAFAFENGSYDGFRVDPTVFLLYPHSWMYSQEFDGTACMVESTL